MGFRMELNGQAKQIDTKNVDKLAEEGIVLDAYYVQCVCSPSRVTFLTGRYPLHHGEDWTGRGGDRKDGAEVRPCVI
eukprot:SAG22_NODE_281_length_13064_cov_13.367605_9_plen_77_part_00